MHIEVYLTQKPDLELGKQNSEIVIPMLATNSSKITIYFLNKTVYHR